MFKIIINDEFMDECTVVQSMLEITRLIGDGEMSGTNPSWELVILPHQKCCITCNNGKRRKEEYSSKLSQYACSKTGNSKSGGMVCSEYKQSDALENKDEKMANPPKLTIDDMTIFEGISVNVQGETFEMHLESAMSSRWVVWESPLHRVYATPNYEIEGVPVDIRDAGDLVLYDDDFYGPVTNITEYIKIVRNQIDILLTKLKEIGYTQPDENMALLTIEYVDMTPELLSIVNSCPAVLMKNMGKFESSLLIEGGTKNVDKLTNEILEKIKPEQYRFYFDTFTSDKPSPEDDVIATLSIKNVNVTPGLRLFLNDMVDFIIDESNDNSIKLLLQGNYGEIIETKDYLIKHILPQEYSVKFDVYSQLNGGCYEFPEDPHR